MRVRKLSDTGDYTIGQGQKNFWINAAAGVGQNVETRLELWEGEWFLDNTVGTPYSTEVLGYNTASLRDIAIKTVILGTPFVSSITAYNSEVNRTTRKFTVSGFVMTAFSPNPVPFGPVGLRGIQ